jgi:glyoxylase-like metal-dependent hydrolase (beta-lactamase superfamily II)
MTARNLSENLHLIPLDLPRKGFHHFLCAWLYKDARSVLLIDPGPRSTMSALLQALEERKVRRIDYVLLTHIHLDHAGGLGLLVDRYPEVKVICHPRGVPHLLQPEKLWEASLKFLQETAVLYGEPTSIQEKHIGTLEDIATGGPAADMGVEAIAAPGHAPHHLCYRIGDILFAGEAAGIFYPMEKGLYLRIAAPPGFDLHNYRISLETLRNIGAAVVCYGHWGLSFEPEKLLQMAATQTELWATVIGKFSKLESPLFEEKVFEALRVQDPGLSRFHQLPADVKIRETFFLNNSFRGIRLALTGDS